MHLAQALLLLRPLMHMAAAVPWERLRHREEIPSLSQMIPEDLKHRLLVRPPSATPSIVVEPPAGRTASSPLIERPGCTAADESLLVLGHLRGLANGKQGFGVLRLDIERLERAAAGAERMGRPEIAAELRRLKEQLPGVRDQNAAEAALQQLEPVVDQAWDLGRICGGHNIRPEIQARASQLSARIRSGELTREQAIEILKKEAAHAQQPGKE